MKNVVLKDVFKEELNPKSNSDQILCTGDNNITLTAKLASTASLGSDGKILTSQLPALAITDVFVANSEQGMLSLNAQKGDVCIRSDVKLNYILSQEPASTLSNWLQLEVSSTQMNNMSISAPATDTSSVTLVGSPCSSVNNMFVMLEHTVLPVSSYSLNSEGTVVTFNPPLKAGLDIDIRWFS